MLTEQLIEDVRFHLVQLVTPFGFTVERLRKGGETRFELRLRVNALESLCCRQVFGSLWAPSRLDIEQGKEHLMSTAEQVARNAVLSAMGAFRTKTLPTAPGIDWRPNESVPEDFHAG